MGYGLGIDTGGTYTDAVIYDFDKNEVLSSAKSVTIKEDLTKGINGAIGQLPGEYLDKVGLVSLSTTLATNACVEGKGSRARLVMIGCDEEIAARYGREYGLPESGEMIFLDGGHSQQGETLREPDWDALRAWVEGCRQDTDAFAIVELWGIRNPEYERKAKELIAGWTGLPAVCGHELTVELNSLKRAASALLNAQLIPIISNFLDAVKESMEQKGISAPLVIVRGDGSLMSEGFARSKPVETLLCGPAASVAGGISLTGEKDCIIVDMGGTTSDIAIVRDGAPKITSDGAVIGKWRTGIKSVHINTVGLGGDSLIRHTQENSLAIGPVRAAPLSWAASRWPVISEGCRRVHESGKRHTLPLCEFFYLIRDITGDAYYSSEEKDIASALRKGPLSVMELAAAAGISVYELRTKRLEQHGIIMRCGLTPTDIMHLIGDFTGWDRDAAYHGAKTMARQINTTLEDLINIVNEHIKEKLYRHIVCMLLEEDDGGLLKGGVSRQLDGLLSESFRRKRKAPDGAQRNLSVACSFATGLTLVGIGAPAHIFLPDVAAALDTASRIPHNAGVANAIGAITGNVLVEERVVIKPQYSTYGITGYTAFSSAGNKAFKMHEKAVEWAMSEAAGLAGKSARERGADGVEISVAVNNEEAEISSVYMEDGSDTEKKGNQLLLESVVTARAAGRIKVPAITKLK